MYCNTHRKGLKIILNLQTEGAKNMENTKTAGRLDPIKKYLFEKGISMAELSRRCEKKLSRHGVAYRVRVGDCLISDMEDMAQAAGYKFVWKWENVREIEPSGRALRPMTAFHSDRLKPINKYLFEKNLSIPDLAKRVNMSRAGMVYRLREGVCMMSDMEQMAEAAGYKFIWSWEPLPAEETPVEA